MNISDKKKLLDQLDQEIKNCSRCSLYQGTNAVPGEGNPDAEIIFLGEAPGFFEDRVGKPFVGRAGQLLEMSLNQINFNRSDVWIGNMIKHRPPANRDPLPNELNACKNFLDRQIKIINPKYVVTLGRFAMEKFISGVFISRIHGQPIPTVWEENHFILFPMFHPAAALRNPKTMIDFKGDFIKLKNILNPSQKAKKIASPDSNNQTTQLNLLSI